MQRICVFSGSNKGIRPEYTRGAYALGQELVRRKLGLVYGGAGVGLMDVVANSVLAGGGEVIGIMPSALLEKEVGHMNLTELRKVSSMHERKAMMADLADGFIALPGGFGTFDELFEIVTWAQLGLHRKPIGLLNISGYYDPLLSFLRQASDEGFIRATHLNILLQDAQPGQLLERFETYAPDISSPWLDLPER